MKLKDFIRQTKTTPTERAIKSIEKESKEDIDSTVEKVIKYVTENPNYAEEILKRILEKDNIPNEVFEEVATQISTNENIPNEIIPNAVDNSNVEVPDTIIANIIDNGDINRKERIALIKSMDSVKIKQKAIEEELNRLYNQCEEETELALVEKLRALNIVKRNETIKSLETRIIAKKMASNFDIFGGTKINTLATYMPAEEMLEIDLPKLVVNESNKLKKKRNDKPIDESNLRSIILEHIAQNIVANYREVEEFIIPQSRNMNQLSKEEEDKFIEDIEKYYRKPLSQSQRSNIQFQIKGKINNLELKDFLIEIRKLPKGDMRDFISTTNMLLEDKENYEIFNQLVNSGIFETLKEIDFKKRGKYISGMSETLQKRVCNEKEVFEKE